MQSTKQRKKLYWAVAASLFLHLLVAYSLVAFNTAFPPPSLTEDDKPAELTVVDLSARPAPEPTATPPFIETEPARETPDEPKEKTFQSNVNSLAASKIGPTGDLPLPSQEGKERPALDFDTHEATLGSQAATAQSPPQPSAPPPTATPPPTLTPRPQPRATPQTTPLPEPSATPSGEQLAMLTGTPPPPIRDPQEGEATPTPEVAATASPSKTRPLPDSPASAYRAEKQEARIAGRITDRGNSSVNAAGTPLGRYQKQVVDAIGARWYYYTKTKDDLLSIGTAQLTAEVDGNGKVQRLRVVSNDSNEAFAIVCLQSFQEADIPPIPPELIPALAGGRLPIQISFIMSPPDDDVRAIDR